MRSRSSVVDLQNFFGMLKFRDVDLKPPPTRGYRLVRIAWLASSSVYDVRKYLNLISLYGGCGMNPHLPSESCLPCRTTSQGKRAFPRYGWMRTDALRRPRTPLDLFITRIQDYLILFATLAFVHSVSVPGPVKCFRRWCSYRYLRISPLHR